MEVAIRPAVEGDIPAIAQVMSEAAVKKAAEGDYLWGDKPYSLHEVESSFKQGGMYAVEGDGKVVGTVTLTDTDERVWEEDGATGDDALYIHSLATADSSRGQNVGERVIEWAVDKARGEGRTKVRLDCSYTNRGLCQYYERRGFHEVRRREIPRKSTARDLRDPTYQVALFQREVA